MRQALAKLVMGTVTAVAVSAAVPAMAQVRAAQAPTGAELAAFKRAIRAQYDLKEKAWAARDHQRLVTGFYSPQAFTAAEGEPKFYAQGRAAFLELYKTYVADTTKIRIESVHTHVNGNMGWDWTNFHADVKPEKVKDYPPSPVRILFVWEKINGQWVCSGDVVLLGSFDTAPRTK
jgi:ketosteroid isomerase-like protein